MLITIINTTLGRKNYFIFLLLHDKLLLVCKF